MQDNKAIYTISTFYIKSVIKTQTQNNLRVGSQSVLLWI
jgi:hypothetical protein